MICQKDYIFTTPFDGPPFIDPFVCPWDKVPENGLDIVPYDGTFV